MPTTTSTTAPVVIGAAVCPAGTDRFGNVVLTPEPSHATALAAVRLAAGTYRIELFTLDSHHAAGYQVEQTAEQWTLEFLDASDTVVALLGPTRDLAETERVAMTGSGTVTLPTEVVALRARHVRSPNANSLTPCVSIAG
ncbi:MAG: hypothetical protein R2705_01585 [Ilumatobacteraceae bacterium]